MLADERAESPYERVLEILNGDALRDALATLGDRQRRTIELRYGLGDERPRTLDDIARTFGVTRERVRQIETQALRRLKELLRERQTIPHDVETDPRRARDHHGADAARATTSPPGSDHAAYSANPSIVNPDNFRARWLIDP